MKNKDFPIFCKENASILKNSGFLDNSFLSASFYSDRMNHSLVLEGS